MVKKSSQGQKLTKNLNFPADLPTFRAENETNSGRFKAKNSPQTIPTQFQNNFEKVQKSAFLVKEMVRKDPLKGCKFDLNFQFSCSCTDLSKLKTQSK